MMRHILIAMLLAGWTAAALPAAEPVKMTDPKDKQILEGFLKNVDKVPSALSPDYCKKIAAEEAESYTWIILPQLEMPLAAYELTGQAKHLDTFVQTFANMRAALTKGPDGTLDWYGKPLDTFQDPNDKDKKLPVMLNAFHTADVVGRFLEAVARDPALTQKYAKERTEYLDLIENNLVKKWHAGDNFVDLGKGGAIYRTHAALKMDKAHLTQPHNKHSIVIRGLLVLYRVTGKDEYMTRAVQAGTRFKHSLTLKDGHYEWDYWDPAGAWDVLPTDPNHWKHWIGVEHKGGYYSSTLSQAVALYQHGVVFERSDIDRFLKTQLEKCWNGDAAAPKWARVDGSVVEAKYMQGDYICGALAPYSGKIADFLYTGPRLEDRLKNANHAWQGGPVAAGWLNGKWVTLPRAKADAQPFLAFGKKFLQKKENQDFVAGLQFEVTGAGYAPPQYPAAMKPMPPEPGK